LGVKQTSSEYPEWRGWRGTESTITEASTGLLYQLRMMMSVAQSV
jgi:hypothetical protein